MLGHGRERAAHDDAALPELVDDRLHVAADADHEEVGFGRQDLVSVRAEIVHGLVAKPERLGQDLLLPRGIVQAGCAAPLDQRIDAVHCLWPHRVDEIGPRDGVTETHRRDAEDLREGPGDDDGAAFEDVWQRRGVVGALHEVVVRLVDEHRHVFGDPVEELLDLLLADDHPGRVVGVAQIDEPQLAIVPFGRGDERADVLGVVLVERQLDRVRLDARRVLIHGAVGRLDAEDFLGAVLEEGVRHDVQDFAGTGAEQNVVRRHVVVGRNRLQDAGVRIPVPVRVLPGGVHRLHHGLERTPRILVAGELGGRVVLGHAAGGRRRQVRRASGRARGRRLGQQRGWTYAGVGKGGGEPADETAAIHFHSPSRG